MTTTISEERVLPLQPADSGSRGIPRLISDSYPVSPQLGNWWSEAEEQFAAIRELPVNWDGDGANRPAPSIVDSTRALLSSLSTLVTKPAIHPTRSGGIQLEWENGDRYFEIEVLSPALASYFFRDDAERVEESAHFSHGPVGWLADDFIYRVYSDAD